MSLEWSLSRMGIRQDKTFGEVYLMATLEFSRPGIRRTEGRHSAPLPLRNEVREHPQGMIILVSPSYLELCLNWKLDLNETLVDRMVLTITPFGSSPAREIVLFQQVNGAAPLNFWGLGNISLEGMDE